MGNACHGIAEMGCPGSDNVRTHRGRMSGPIPTPVEIVAVSYAYSLKVLECD